MAHCRLSTLVEPLTESIVCGLIGASSITSLVHRNFPLPRLFATGILFFLNMYCWYRVDQSVYRALLPAAPLARQPATVYEKVDSLAFFKAWLLRETLAFPIWLYAMLGNTVAWRDSNVVYSERILRAV